MVKNFSVKTQWNLAAAFFRVGILGFGGGPSSIPLVHQEVVDKYEWVTKDEFSDILALGNTLPGPIATKMAGYIGYRVGGWIGCLNALLVTSVPTVMAMILLFSTFQQYQHVPWVAGMAKGVVPIIAVMLGVLTWDFLQSSIAKLGKTMAFTLIAISAVVLFFIHPAILLVSLILFALRPRRERAKE
ncbi:chromate transporter [Mangrovibacillus cuniculi]|uniref:Chromate transporter n=1 Tax=Mangrovibacillus cuniculi TaxID=2593652 RepID=A0A7S8HGF3_9BACI|nr:chromate transporter [Mangrovibacillus cuniculi]QPC47496.1 chromate transporter [Mangrovibacillus cuniculi]